MHQQACLPQENLQEGAMYFYCYYFFVLELIYFNYSAYNKLDSVHPLILAIIFFFFNVTSRTPVDLQDICIFSRFLELLKIMMRRIIMFWKLMSPVCQSSSL